MKHKQCEKCRRRKPATAEYFYRRAGNTDGLNSKCRTCMQALRAERSPHEKKQEKDRLRKVYESRKVFQQIRREENRAANKKLFAERQRQWRKALSPADKEAARIRARNWYDNNKTKYLARKKAKRDDLKKQMIAAYGGKCVCCNETEPNFLTIDHKNGGGRLHREIVNAGGNGILMDLRRRGWPQDEYQLLCYNCNCGRARNGGICPHQENRSN